MADKVLVLSWNCIGCLGLLVLFVSVADGATNQTKSKRQIYREQVLPHSGGKIPEDAFRADRLALNRLNKEGISIPDGVLLDHREPHSHPHQNRHDPEDHSSIVKILQQPDGRYTPPEGRYYNQNSDTIDSTYLIRRPIGREETHIRTPDQQMPLHKYLENQEKHRQINQPPQEYYYEQPPPINYEHPPAQPPPTPIIFPGGFEYAAQHPNYHQPSQPNYQQPPQPNYQQPPQPNYQQPPQASFQQYFKTPTVITYQEIKHIPPTPRYPIPVPFELPNKETLEPEYYKKIPDIAYQDYKKVTEIPYQDDDEIDWSYILNRYTSFADDVNGLLVHQTESIYTPRPYHRSHSVIYAPEHLGPDENSLYITSERYARKSPELSIGTRLKKKSEFGEKVLKKKIPKYKCVDGVENVVPDIKYKCQVYSVCHGNGDLKTYVCPRGQAYSSTIGKCDSAHRVKCGI